MFFFLNFLLIFFIVISNKDIQIDGEMYFVEILQLVILSSCFFIHVRYKKMFLELSNLFIFNIRLLLFIFLIYEEISFIIPFSSDLITNINRQNEINIHNLNFLLNFLEINIPGLNYSFSINLYVFSIVGFLFLYGNGLFLPILKKFRYLFLEKHFSLFSYVFLVNLIVSSIIRRYFDASFLYLMDLELVELFLYIVFLLDVVKKMNIVKKLTS